MTRMKRRDSIAILADILSIVASHGSLRKTRLMNYANLNPRTFNLYISRLEESGLIRLVDGNTYQLTSRGAAFISIYNFFTRIFSKPFQRYDSILQELEKIVSTRGNIRTSYMLSSGSGAKHYYDMLIIRDNRPAIAIYDATTSSQAIRPFELGIILLSCVENPNIHHILVAENQAARYYQNILTRLQPAGLCNLTVVQPSSPEDIIETVEKALSSEESRGTEK
jgi:predicted transcriptional regulator